jgi:hypothetical protein
LTGSSEFVTATRSFLAIHNAETDEWRLAQSNAVVTLEEWEDATESVQRGDVLGTYNLMPTHFPQFFEPLPAEIAPGASARVSA